MARRFREHQLRSVVCLDGLWDFALLGDIDFERVTPRELTLHDVMAVPGCFDATPKYAGRRGVAVYRRRVFVDGPGPMRLEVDGAHHLSRVFIDGEPIGDHAGGFTRFFHDFDVSRRGEIEITIAVDNRFDGQRSPLHLDYFDWYHYGGLSRGVRLHRVSETFIERVETRTVGLAPPRLASRLFYRSQAPDVELPLAATWNGVEVLTTSVKLTQPQGHLDFELTLDGAALWSPEQPNLHDLQVRLGDDDLCARIGLRQVSTRDNRLCINDTPVRLRGVNRHEAHPSFGHAVPAALQLGDVQLVQQLGANFVRGSHYPQDPGFLDLCDELGLLVWNEGIGWQHRVEHLMDAGFLDAQRRHLDEMLDMSFNHPSVVMWGILNESDSTKPEAKPAFEQLFAQIKQRDPSRPVTFATCRPHDDLCLDLVDLVSVNTYPGWYSGDIQQIPEKLSELIAFLRQQVPDKPILVSEIGAGALYGTRDHNQQRWSEEFQAELLDVSLGFLLAEHSDCAGVALWQFCDCRTAERVESILGRPRGFNNKGLVDEYRRKKLGYDVVARHFAEAARRSSSE